MSGRSRKIIYRVFSALLFLAGVAGTACIGYFSCAAAAAGVAEYVVIGCAVALTGLFAAFDCSLGAIVHEAGHALCAWLVGFRVLSLKIGGRTAGESVVVPKSDKGVRGKYAFIALGGSLLNLLYGAAVLILYFLLPPHPAILFFAMLAPLQLSFGLSELIPAQLPTGRTDGEVLRGLQKRLPFAELSLVLLSVQGILYRGSYSDVPRELLLSAPTVAEDDLLFSALQIMRLQCAVAIGDDAWAKETATRWDARYRAQGDGEEVFVPAEDAGFLCYCFSALLPDGARAEFYLDYLNEREGGFAHWLANAATGRGDALERARKIAKKEPLCGVREAEELMLQKLTK